MRTVSELSNIGDPSVRQLLRGIRGEFSNWYVVGPLSWAALPSRCPPSQGIPRLARKRVAVKMRSGYVAECRLDEFFPFVEIFALGAYDVPGLCWSELRTIVDVGANVGAATLWFARRSPRARIVAVEPGSRVREVLTRNVRANQLEGRVEVVAVAVADGTGVVELEQPPASVYARIGDAGHHQAETVRALSLEDLLNGCGLSEVDLLKLDCEGAEFDVLLSSDDRVLRRNRIIVGEYHSAGRADRERLVDRLNQAGFQTSSSDDDSIGVFEAIRV